jgi:hypothetical protein
MAAPLCPYETTTHAHNLSRASVSDPRKEPPSAQKHGCKTSPLLPSPLLPLRYAVKARRMRPHALPDLGQRGSSLALSPLLLKRNPKGSHGTTCH